MPDIFISYSRRDKEYVWRIFEALKLAGLDVWIDLEDIPKGEDWEQEIYRGILSTDAFLFMISPHSLRSEICNREIEHALEYGKRILPIIICDVDEREVYGLTDCFLLEETKVQVRRINFLFCREARDDFGKALEEIQETIRTDYAWVRYHTDLQEKSQAWKENQDSSLLLRGKALQEAEQQLAGTRLSPLPTDLQRQYVLKSRHQADRIRRGVTSGAIAVAAIMLVLAVVALFQRSEAVKQARIALSRQLVAQAQTINATRSSKQFIAVLLATKSMDLLPSSEASQVLLGNLTGHAVYSLNQSQEGDVIAIAYSPDGKYLASAGGKVVHILEAATGKEIGKVQQDDTVYAVTFSPDGRLLASGGRDQTVRIWDPQTGKELHRLQQDGEVRDVVFSPDGKALAGGGFKAIRIWDTRTGDEVAKLAIKNTGPIWKLAFSPDGKWIASADAKTARVWDAAKGKEILRRKSRGELKTVAFSPDSKYLVSNCDDMSACVWEIESGQEKARMAHGGTVMSAVFSHNGKLLATGSRD